MLHSSVRYSTSVPFHRFPTSCVFHPVCGLLCRGAAPSPPQTAAVTTSLVAVYLSLGAMRFLTATGAWDWWRGLNPTRFVAAPMVDQSELAFRMLCRELGVGLCYTPMLHARLMTEHPAYKKLHFDGGGENDRPLFGQLAGHDPQVVLSAARLIEDSVSAVDLNFGCPQAIARKGRYGAFLLEEPGVPVQPVETLARELSVPVTAKVRILPSGIDDSIELCLRMQDAGAAALCVHGRTRAMNKQNSGEADWEAVRRLVEALDIPVIATQP